MGTYSGYSTRRSIQDELTLNGARRFAWVGNHLWYVVEPRSSDVGKAFIELALVQRYGPYEWAYKPIDESMGPRYWDCPKSLLQLVPDPEVGYSTSWREGCKAHQEARRRRRR